MKKNGLICIVLLFLCICFANHSVEAADAEMELPGSVQAEIKIDIVYPWENEWYSSSHNDEDTESNVTDEFDIYMSDSSEIVQWLRDGMENRQSEVIIHCKTDELLNEEKILDLIEEAMEETESSTQGDYLRFGVKNYLCEAKGFVTWWGNIYYILNYRFTYFTTKDQEEELSKHLEALLTSFGFTETTSDIEKVQVIYDYITENVVYDYKTLNDNSYLLKYTAYAAFENKTAVCQGYATLLYRMAKMSGLDCRVISGLGYTASMPEGGAHAWNIVKVDSKYYYVDATWDAGGPYKYFLKGRNDFSNHQSAEKYLIGSFLEAHPIAADGIEEKIEYAKTDEDKSVDSIYMSLEFHRALYTGKAIEPEVTVKDEQGNILQEGIDYSISYEDNIDAGQASVILTGKGKYIGSITKTFSINKDTERLEVGKQFYKKKYGDDAFSLNVDFDSGVIVKYRSDNKKVAAVSDKGIVKIKGVGTANITVSTTGNHNFNASEETITVQVVPAKMKIKRIESGKGFIKIHWAKAKDVTGYQVLIAKDKKFKKGVQVVTLSKSKYKSKSIKKLEKKNVYYVKIRAYKKIGKTCYYGDFSAVKKIKTK